MGTTGMSPRPVGDPRRYNPFRRPDWRWRAAWSLHARCEHPQEWEDPAIHAALRYLRGSAAGESPGLAMAHAIYLEGGVARDEVEARLLAGEGAGVIANKLRDSAPGVTAGAVAAYETFFDVAESLGATDWLLSQAVGVRPALGRPVTEREVWCYWAVGGGPPVVDLLVADYLGRPEPAVPDRHLAAERARFLVREYAADWSSREEAAALIEEGCRLFGHLLCDAGGGAEAERLGLYVRFLRLAYGLTPPPEPGRGTGEGPSYGDRNKDKDNAGGQPF